MITASETMREWGNRLMDLLAGDWESLEDAEEFHTFTIERDDGRPMLEIVQARERDEIDLGVSTPTFQHVYLFRPPEGEPVLAVDVETGLTNTYTIRDARSGTILATLEKSRFVLGTWQLTEPGGDVRATVDRRRSLRGLVSSTTSYAVSTPDGDEVASLEYQRGSGNITDMVLPEMEISCERSRIPTELRLAAAFGIFREINESSSSSSSGGGVE